MANEFKIKHGFVSTGNGIVEGEIRITGAAYADNNSRLATRAWTTQFLADNNYLVSSDLPTNVSAFTNDAAYITDGNTGWNNTYGFITASDSITGNASSATSVVTLQDTAPDGVNGKLWWETDTGKLKVYYGDSSAWIDALPLPDTSLFYTRSGGAIDGDVYIGQILTVEGNITTSSSFVGPLEGNASTATQLATARNIALTGAVTGNANFDGSGNISISTTATSDPTLTINGDASGSATFTNLGNATLTLTISDDSHIHDGRYYTKTESDVRYDAIGAADTVNDRIDTEVLPSIPTNVSELTNDAAYITDGNTGWNNSYGFITASDSITGNAATATKASKLSVTSNDTFSGTYPVMWHDSDFIYSSTWMTVNGATDTLNVPNITVSGNMSIGSISNPDGMIENTNGNYLHIGGWGVGRTAATAVLVNTAYRADRLDTGRNIALSGDVTGSANFDGSSDITITATVANDSHTHDGRYYTESESDARFVNVTGDTITGDLFISGASLGVTSTAEGTEAFYVDGVNGRLFTISDDLSDSLFSVNTISGLPVIEAFADNTVKIGPFTNPVTIDSSGVLSIGGLTAATQTYVDTAVSNLIGGAPGALDTLNELAAAINDDASFASSVTSSLALKAPLASPALTGTPTAPTAATATNTTQIATTAFVKAQGYVTTDTNYYLNGISRSGNVLTFSVAGATNQTYTFGSAAWAATTAFDSAGTGAAAAGVVNTRIDEELLPLIGSITLSNLNGLAVDGKAADSNLLDGINSSSFLRSDANDTFTGTITMGKQHALVANNYGRGVYGTYSATRYQHVWGMGTAYNLADDGTGTGNLYGIAWTHSNIGGESISGLGHQMLIMSNGDTRSAIGDGIWTKYNIYASGGDSTNWNAAYGWGDHGAAGYATETWVGEQNFATDAAINTAIATVTLASLGYTGATNANYITNNNQLTNGAGYLTSTNDRVYITDSRGAVRAPSYYNDRYAQWDFQNVGDTGVGGDGWHALLTVSKWSSFDPSHRQEQLIFSGDHLWRRTAESDADWGDNKKIWDSGNLDAFVGATVSNDTITFTKANGGTVAVTTSDADTNTWRPIDDTPVNGVTTESISSNWAYDHVNASNPHGTTAADVGADPVGSAAAVDSRIDTDVLPAIPTNNNQLTNGAGYITSYVNTTYTAGSGLKLSGTTFRLNGGEIPAGVDLNTYRTTGIYAQNSNSDTTSGSNWPTNFAGILEVWNDDYGNGVHCTQRYSRYNTVDVYQRNYYNGTWTSWRNLTQDTNTTYSTSDFDAAGSAATAQANAIAHADNRIDTDVLPAIPTNNNQLTNGAGYITSADGGNANLLDGLDLHTGRNNEVNKVVRTDANGYIQAGWINSTSGDNGTTGINRIYASQDGYIRYYTPANFISVLGLATTSNIKDNAVVTIQDAAPTGVDGKLWWESDTGKLKVYYGSSSAWIDAVPIPDVSIYYPKSGGAITGDVLIEQTLTVVGNTLIEGTLTETSDINLKENIEPLENALGKVISLEGVSFNKKDTPEVKEIGFIAQQVEKIVPELVTETESGIKTVSYTRVSALLVETVKEQQKEIDSLKALVADLANKINNL